MWPEDFDQDVCRDRTRPFCEQNFEQLPPGARMPVTLGNCSARAPPEACPMCKSGSWRLKPRSDAAHLVRLDSWVSGAWVVHGSYWQVPSQFLHPPVSRNPVSSFYSTRASSASPSRTSARWRHRMRRLIARQLHRYDGSLLCYRQQSRHTSGDDTRFLGWGDGYAASSHSLVPSSPARRYRSHPNR